MFSLLKRKAVIYFDLKRKVTNEILNFLWNLYGRSNYPCMDSFKRQSSDFANSTAPKIIQIIGYVLQYRSPLELRCILIPHTDT